MEDDELMELAEQAGVSPDEVEGVMDAIQAFYDHEADLDKLLLAEQLGVSPDEVDDVCDAMDAAYEDIAGVVIDYDELQFAERY